MAVVVHGGDEEGIDNGTNCDDISASNDGGDDDPFRRPSYHAFASAISSIHYVR